MTMPNFVVIGAPKCGTDALYHHLKEHPEIYMSPVKEPMFFAIEGQLDIPYRGPRDREQLQLECWVPTLDRYQALFDRVTDEKAIGEASTWYLYDETAHRRIWHYLPHAKLIAVLRNPVDRAYSAYTMLVRDGREPLQDFAGALAAEDERIRARWQPGWHYMANGFYYGQLKRYYDTFDPKQIHVILYDDFRSKPTEVIRGLFAFLEVNETFQSDAARQTNVSLVPKHFRYHMFVAGQNPLKTAARSLLPAGVRQRLKTSLVDANLTRPAPVPTNIRSELTQMYRPDILRLEELIGRDLSSWLDLGQSAHADQAA